MYKDLVNTTVSSTKSGQLFIDLLKRLYNELIPVDYADDRSVIAIDVGLLPSGTEATREITIGYDTENIDKIYVSHFDENKNPCRVKSLLPISALLNPSEYNEFIIPFNVRGLIYTNKDINYEFYTVVD